ncbi:putative carnitine operon oxidoreductase [Escherichia coli]|nr:putative carnitine operon oxidoreductase [Escherichia coli]
MALIAMVLMLMGKKAYINLDYVALETVADGSYAVAIRQGNIGNDSNLLIVFYVQIMPDDFVMQLHRF